jgi:hypothetical protein
VVGTLLRLASGNDVSWGDARTGSRALRRDGDPSKKQRVCGRVHLNGCVICQDEESGAGQPLVPPLLVTRSCDATNLSSLEMMGSMSSILPPVGFDTLHPASWLLNWETSVTALASGCKTEADLVSPLTCLSFWAERARFELGSLSLSRLRFLIAPSLADAPFAPAIE